MNFHYDITIKGSKDTIEFKTSDTQNDAITGLKFGFNSDDATRERDRNGRIEIVVYGKFDGEPETMTAINKLAEWAKSKEDVYREVTIIQKTFDNDADEGNFSRTYHFDKMFCIDYFERSGTAIEKEDDKVGLEFELFMAQAPTYKISKTSIEQL